MTPSRRTFLASTGAAVTLMPFAFGPARADGHAMDTIETENGQVRIQPVDHASFVMDTTGVVVAVDPVGDPARYKENDTPGMVLITHEHGDHFDIDTITELTKWPETKLVVNPAVHAKLPADLADRAVVLANGDTTFQGGIDITAIPAYNITEDRLNFHPQGRDNGYVLDINGFRVYISGDTEDIPEMRSLENIDLAFVCMNLPFTMSAEAAASAVADFAPAFVYPYHYRGRDNGTQDPMEFANMLPDGIEAKMGGWYDT
ncbi:MBL fold metallo-hydrolase [Pseudooctadecabacter sp.]|uniref:MBL fold metallo-hydrolase n=1 Tax=Pseudooctadecabacter sp. TaxID=1966338 RepID=UPI0025D38BD7|nr:MBL fold metallo-hydrolase [Pseudooctadecabacter sp.]